MKFEVSERIQTSASREAILAELEAQLSKVSQRVVPDGNGFAAYGVECTFGSANRKDVTRVSLREVNGGVLVTGDAEYTPTLWFAFWFVLGFFCCLVGIVFPLFFFLSQRKTVESALKAVFSRVNNEFHENGATAQQSIAAPSNNIDQLEKLAGMKERGLLSQEEFDAKKKELLGL